MARSGQAHASPVRTLVRHDPFDRLLVAQATRAGLRLLTADQVLLGLGRDFIIDANRLRLTGQDSAG
jgi:PIN domain nuclease of toxin-antitoxin system